VVTGDTASELAGRVAVVTGGSGSIGAATCRLFAGHGMRVAVVGRDEAALTEVRDQVRGGGGEAIAVRADVTDVDALAALRDRVAAELGPVDVLAAFAGGNGHPRPSVDLPADEWRRIIEGDLTGTFLTVQAFLPGMLERGRGSVITMASSAGRQPSQANVGYAAAKAGVVMLTRHLAAELAPRGVRVNCVAPSAVHNRKMDERMTPEQIAELGRMFPLRRIGEPDDVARAAAFLASDAASWITGITIDVAGGKVIP
jgi:3-oxoacyl-[acyl-carrier protein] reductase